MVKRTAGILYLCAVLVFAGTGNQRAAAGVLKGISGVRMIQTVYFDIIYPPESAAAASVLASCADDLYETACAELGSVPYLRMPVVITPSHDTLNAYFTPLPYNRIVIYDTLPFSNDSSSLAVFSRSLQSVFYHELVHAVSLNIKSPAFRVLSDVFADCLNPALAAVPPLLSEGAAVALESRGGEGRLHDAFSVHMVYQSKLEGLFPAWRDAAGARDIYPSGSVPYIFGGAFTEWLLDTYGEEPYAAFWYECGRLQFFKLTAGIFKKVYGITLADAWHAFESQLALPVVSAEPDALPGIEYSVLNRNRSLYRSLTSCAEGTAWIDPYTSSVRFAAAGGTAAVTLLTMSGLDKIAFSSDGAYLALTRTVTETFSKSEVFIYRMSTGTVMRLPSDHVRDGIVLCLSDGRYAAAAVQISSQSASIVLHEITEQRAGRPVIHAEKLQRFDFAAGITPLSLCAAEGGQLAFTVSGAPYSLQSVCLLDPVSGIVTEYAVPDSPEYRNFRIRSIVSVPVQYAERNVNPPEVCLVFSWAAEGTFPRIGFFTLVSDENAGTGLSAFFSLMDADVSGGVYAPVPVSGYNTGEHEGGRPKTFLYSAHLFDHDNLMVLDTAEVPFIQTFTASIPVNFASVQGSPDIAVSVSSYNPFLYMLSGVFLPAALIPQYDILNQTGTALMLGATWITADPAETVIIAAGGGFNPVTLDSGISVSAYTTGTSFSVNASSNIAFTKNGFRQAVTAAGFESVLPAGRFSRFICSDTLSWFAGYAGDPAVFQHAAENVFRIGYSSLRSGGRGYYNIRGFSASVFADILYAQFSDVWYGNAGGSAALRIPGVVPAGLSVFLFPDMKTFFQFRGETVLYSFEIQKGIPVIPLYINRLAFIAGYEGEFARTNDSWDIIRLPLILRGISNIPYYDQIYLAAELIFALNTGILTGTRFSVSAKCAYLIRDKISPGKVQFSLGGSLLY